MNVNIGMSLPPQMLPLSKKTDRWKKDCMDALETIGREQFWSNARLIENYEMLKGKFIFQHYVSQEDYQDLVSKLSEEFEIPVHLRHYDIISQVTNTLSGEWQKRPDLFRVKDYSEQAKNNYRREKSQFLLRYVKSQLDAWVVQNLLAEGLDPQKSDFLSEEEQVQYQQILQQRIEELTPPEIQQYMDMDWRDIAEIWGEHQIEHDNEKYKRKETDRLMFDDMLASDRAFKHFYIVPDGYGEEVWNPINTFFHKSPEIRYIEEGDYVGRIFYLSSSEIINRYGYKMSEKQILQLEKFRKETYESGFTGSFGENYAGVNLQPNTVIPFKDYPQLKIAQAYLGQDPNNPRTIDSNIMEALGGQRGYSPSSNGILFQVTEAYWMSQERIGKYVYPDAETGEPQIILVDETFNYKLIPDLDIRHNSFMDFSQEEEINTLTWTWVNKCYKGIKINNTHYGMEEPIYIDIGPNDYQFKGDQNLYGAKLPVCGQIFNNRNGESASLVDLMKPDQIGHNVASNQLYELMQREIGRFMLMDTNLIPSTKDWGGDGNFERLMLVAKNLGIAPVDGAQTGAQRTNFSHFQMVDLDETSRMVSRMNIADYFERKALSRVGITPQRLGSVAASESATGVNQAVSQSFAQTESYFTRFSEFSKRCLQMSLDIAQYVQSQKIDINIMNLKSDASRAYIELSATDITNADLGLYVSDSREIIRQLETVRQLFLNNNTTGATPPDLAEVIFTNSPAKIKTQLETSWREQQERQQQAEQQQVQLQQQQIEANQQLEAARIAKEDERLDKKLANDRYIAEIKAVATSNLGQNQDIDNSGIPDPLEVRKFNAELNKSSEDILFKREQETNKKTESMNKALFEREKLRFENKKLEEDSKQREADRKLKEKELKVDLEKAKYQDKGTRNSPNK